LLIGGRSAKRNRSLRGQLLPRHDRQIRGVRP
jgi:hypothetical protein